MRAASTARLDVVQDRLVANVVVVDFDERLDCNRLIKRHASKRRVLSPMSLEKKTGETMSGSSGSCEMISIPETIFFAFVVLGGA